MRSIFQLVVGSGLLTSLCACRPDVTTVADSPSEHGRWVVAMATRGGRPTHTLDAAYFEFDTATSLLKTNFTGQEEALRYELDETGFATPEGELFKHIDVVTKQDSLLDLSTTIQGTRFTFRLRPEAANVEEELPPVGRPAEPLEDAPLDDDPQENM